MAETHKLVMDPSETLQEIRELLIAHRKSNGYKGTLEEVAERVEALDDWLSKGGYPPDEWAPPTASPKTRRGDRKRPTYESYAHNTARSGDGTVPVIWRTSRTASTTAMSWGAIGTSRPTSTPGTSRTGQRNGTNWREALAIP
jgi:hypothetical protein